MAYSRIFTPRGFAFISAFSLGGGYLVLKSSRAAVAHRQQREAGDYSVEVDRSGGGI
ncbi:hypothetical protein DM02DRAFT_612063 [Periconia macrospinosa]|uniref:Uncharacterized protein n=1 Tax=Periconia macrospinosa TaxID=97972 RepID=A0A2V1DZI4_9PLEO|nr:hypothetical protein DM02DRAFT_612063 [Periconia macrospinosa]